MYDAILTWFSVLVDQCVFYRLWWCRFGTGCHVEYWNEWRTAGQQPESQASEPRLLSWSDEDDNKKEKKTKN